MQQSKTSNEWSRSLLLLQMSALLFAGAVLQAGCSSDSSEGGGSLTAQSFFNDEVFPAMSDAGCVGCHTSGMAPYLAGDDPYATIKSYTPTKDGASSMINTETPADSHVLNYPNGGSHPGGALPDSLETLLLDWIGRE